MLDSHTRVVWTRGRAIAAMAAGAAVLAAITVSGAQAPRLDLNHPDDAVKASRKVQASLTDGKPVTYWFQGSAYSRVPGERDRLLFHYQAMNVRATVTVSEPGRGYGFRHVSRELLIYQDPVTRQALKTWKNPWTGKEVEVVHVANDPVNSRPTFAQGPNGPYRFPVTIKDGIGIWMIEVPLFYTNPLGGDYQPYVGNDYQAMEIFNFFFNERTLLSTDPDADDVSVSWCRVSGWLPWMEMGSRAGQMIYNGAGRKVAGFDALPEVLKTAINTDYPEYKTPPPLDDNRPNETSWTYFKKVIDRKRAEQKK